LHETYEVALGKIAPLNKKRVRRVLLWLGFSILPLTLVELPEAIAIDESLDYIDDQSRLNDPETILKLCGSHLSTSPSGHAQLAHLSVRDYLLSDEIKQSRIASYFAIAPVEAKHELAT
jgi:hypothetical protein